MNEAEYTLDNSIYRKILKMQMILSWQEACQWFTGDEDGGGHILQWDIRKILEVMEMFIILIMVIISQECTHVRTGQIE